jgi:hypothetical protein
MDRTIGKLSGLKVVELILISGTTRGGEEAWREAVMDQELGETVEKIGVWWEGELGLEGIIVFSVLTRSTWHVEEEEDSEDWAAGEERCEYSGYENCVSSNITCFETNNHKVGTW